MSLIGQYNAAESSRRYSHARQAYRSGLGYRDEQRAQKYTTEKAIQAGSPIDPDLGQPTVFTLRDKMDLRRV